MKMSSIFITAGILFLFAGNALGFQPHIPTGSLIEINPKLKIGNYKRINPHYSGTVDTCPSEKISVNEEEGTRTYPPYVFENFITWNQGPFTYLWEQGSSAVKTAIPRGSYTYDINDYKILFGYDGKIFLYDVVSETISQMSTSTPQAYYASYDNNELAYLYDHGTYFLSGPTIMKINSFDNDIEYSSPSLHNGKIAWAEQADNDYFQIFLWNGTTITQITMTSYNNLFPNLHNGKIAWAGEKNGHFQIFYWDGDNITQITDTDYDNEYPKLYNGKIVWHGYKDGDAEIFYWDGNSIRQLTNNDYNDLFPDIYNGRVAWMQKERGAWYGKSIYTCMAETPLKPSVSYGPVTDRTSTGVEVNGSVNPNGESTEYRFEYGTTASYSSFTPWTSAGNGTTSIAANATIDNLTPDTTYHYRLVAKNVNGQTNGSDQTFRTLPNAPILPTVTTGDVTGTDPYILSATINPNGFDTTFYFEYGTDTSYGYTTPVSGAGSGNTTVTVTTPLSGLQRDTTYHYRVVARNAAGTAEGEDKTFTTPAESIPEMNVPSGQNTYTYLPTEHPVLNIDPASAKPLAVGNLLGGTLSLEAGLRAFANPVDIYLGISYSGLPDDIFLIDSSNGLQENTIVPWKTNQTDAINESLFGDINTHDLPEGTYTLYTLVVPAGASDMNNSYLWITSFNITH